LKETLIPCFKICYFNNYSKIGNKVNFYTQNSSMSYKLDPHFIVLVDLFLYKAMNQAPIAIYF